MPNKLPCAVSIRNHRLCTSEAAQQKVTEYRIELSQGINPNTRKDNLRKDAIQEHVNNQKIPTLLDAYE